LTLNIPIEKFFEENRKISTLISQFFTYKKMNIKIRIITYLSVTGILLILLLQAYIVYDNYKQTRASLTRETNAIIEDAFRKELGQRNSFYKHFTGEDTLRTPPPQVKKNTAEYNMNEIKAYKDNLPLFLELVMNRFVSRTVPMNLHNLDSITGNILQSRNIHSEYIVYLVDFNTNKVLDQSKKDFQLSLFLILSKSLSIDIDKKKALKLVLINPFTSVFKHMGTVLASSFLVSLFCLYGLWFLFRTLTSQKKLMEVKNDFFGNTAHELKRPVAQLHLALEALSKPAVHENAVKRERYLSISKEATKDMSEKITMIMTLSMAEEGVFRLNYSRFDLLEEVQKLKEQFSVVAGKEIKIEIENTVANAPINADKDHLMQCIANLIDNAIKYSGVSVLVSIGINRAKDMFLLSVKDNGIGIKPDQLEKIFVKYTRLNRNPGSPQGFGIGLSYAKAVVDKHDGHIRVKSEEGLGSEFSILIPG